MLERFLLFLGSQISPQNCLPVPLKILNLLVTYFCASVPGQCPSFFLGVNLLALPLVCRFPDFLQKCLTCC